MRTKSVYALESKRFVMPVRREMTTWWMPCVAQYA